MYDDTIRDATVYTLGDREFEVNNPPSERYIDIMVRGCKHFGVKQEYIDWLVNHEQQPRKKLEDFDSFDRNGLPKMTME